MKARFGVSRRYLRKRGRTEFKLRVHRSDLLENHPQHFFDACDALGDFSRSIDPKRNVLALASREQLVECDVLVDDAFEARVHEDDLVDAEPARVTGVLAFAAAHGRE